MASKMPDDITSGDVVQVVMHGTLVPAFRAWLSSKGLTFSSFPADENDLPTFMVGVGDKDKLWKGDYPPTVRYVMTVSDGGVVEIWNRDSRSMADLVGDLRVIADGFESEEVRRVR